MNAELKERLVRKKEVAESQLRFLQRHAAITFLRWWAQNTGKEDAYLWHHIAKRIGQGYGEVETEEIHPNWYRIKVTYKGQVYSWRVPGPQ